MRERLPVIWRNLILLYLGIFLAMAAWGSAGEMMNRRAWPAASVVGQEERNPSLQELLGLWSPGRNLWQRLLQLGIPGFSPSRPSKLTLVAPVRRASPSPSPVFAWLCCSTPVYPGWAKGKVS